MLLLMMLMPLQAFAMEEVAVEIPFTIENASGTVVIEAIDGAPLPEKTEYVDVTAGKIVLSYGEPGDYAYKIYQKAGTQQDVTYDGTVYDVIVSVFVNEKGGLYTVVTVSVPGDSTKPDSLVFTNILPEPKDPTGNANTPATGDQTHLSGWIMLAAVSFAGVLVIVPVSRRRYEAKNDR